MATVAKKIIQSLGISSMARTARTTAEYADLVARVTDDLDSAKEHYAALERERETVLLDGDDTGDFHERLFEAGEVVKTLRLNLAEAQRRATNAKSIQYREDLEATTRQVREVDVAAAEQALVEFHNLCRLVTEAKERASSHLDAIKRNDETVKGHGRSDLVIGVSALQARIAKSLRDAPEGEAPARFSGELDVAYNLRIQNHSQKQAEIAQRDNPFKIAGEAALHAIEQMIRQPGVIEASRDTRRMSVSRYQGPDGGQITKIVPVDGLPSRGNYGLKK